jgi:hypothetical protein
VEIPVKYLDIILDVVVAFCFMTNIVGATSPEPEPENGSCNIVGSFIMISTAIVAKILAKMV